MMKTILMKKRWMTKRLMKKMTFMRTDMIAMVGMVAMEDLSAHMEAMLHAALR